jgi:hypothetical protein
MGARHLCAGLQDSFPLQTALGKSFQVPGTLGNLFTFS